jgi:ABC-2 type transport system permease protein
MQSSKYLSIIKISMQDNLEYRFNFFTTFIFMIAPLAVHICLWTTVYGVGVSEENLSNYSYQMMITYTILGHCLDKFTVDINQQLRVCNEIQDGVISKYLLLPVSYFNTNVSYLITNRIVYFVTLIIPYLLVIFCFRSQFMFNSDLMYFLIFIIAILAAIFISFMVNHLIALVTFWLKDISSLYVFTQSTFSFLAGGYFTLDLLPTWAFNLLMHTPFPYILYFPVAIYMKKLDLGKIKYYGMIAGIWIVVLLILNSIVWKRGVKKYSADGM